MRRLWIQRHKALAACAMKIRIYIEDPVRGELDIDGVRCRRLGKLRNGERRGFRIGENAARIFVISDKLSRNVFHEVYQIEAGEEDVFLSGRNYFRPFSGNPFYFDGPAAPEVLKGRKKVQKRGKILLLVSALVGLLAGAAIGTALGNARPEEQAAASVSAAEPWSFAAEGLEITLTTRYSKMEMDGYTVCFGSPDTVVFALREDFALAQGFGELSLPEYGTLVLETNGLTDTAQLQQSDGLCWFEYDYENPETGEKLNYFSVVCKGPDAFWLLQFATEVEKAQDYRPDFVAFAKSVKLGGTV